MNIQAKKSIAVVGPRTDIKSGSRDSDTKLNPLTPTLSREERGLLRHPQEGEGIQLKFDIPPT
jgi:hypothetical protein